MSNWKGYAYYYSGEADKRRSERDAALERVDALEKALSFYADNWNNYCGDHGVPIGLEPNEKLLADMGATAQSALRLRSERTDRDKPWCRPPTLGEEVSAMMARWWKRRAKGVQS